MAQLDVAAGEDTSTEKLCESLTSEVIAHRWLKRFSRRGVMGNYLTRLDHQANYHS